jgi:hypothetical protein
MTDSYEGLLGYYYFGFHSALTRYRALTVQGWIVTAAGTAGFFVFLRDGDGLFPLAVALCAAVAGISLVHQSVAALDQYVRVPVARPAPGSFPGNIEGGIDECARLMEEIDRGGWQEALAALGALGEMTGRFSFPPLR